MTFCFYCFMFQLQTTYVDVCTLYGCYCLHDMVLVLNASRFQSRKNESIWNNKILFFSPLLLLSSYTSTYVLPLTSLYLLFYLYFFFFIVLFVLFSILVWESHRNNLINNGLRLFVFSIKSRMFFFFLLLSNKYDSS